MNIYHVYENDDYGRPTKTIRYVEAESKTDAREKVSMHLYGTTDSGIVKTGYYGADEIKLSEIQAKADKLRQELGKLENII